ncbi:putative zinc protease RF_0338 [Calliopsis andreniformis]|uniref:putative zinc protease RF_0338 n=1 Tax=Calliopsis andreniformis TaxID=337506 RepID=UPI003FCC2912
MAFKGTKTRTAFEIAKAFDDIGGIFNASSGRESTTYYAKVLKKVIKTEIFQTNGSSSDIVFDKYLEAAYEDQPSGRSILGTQHSVKSVTRGDLDNYINEHYFGKYMLFTVAGNIHSEELKKSQNTICTGGEYLHHRNLDQVYLLIGLPSVSRHDGKYHTFQVLDSILGSGMSSRLFQEVRENQGLAYSVYSFDSSYADIGMFSIFAGTDNSSLDKLLKSMTTESQKLSTDNLREEEVNRVKERIKSLILMSRGSVSSRAETLGHYYGNYNSAVTTANHEETTLAVIGEMKSMPSYDKVISMLKA